MDPIINNRKRSAPSVHINNNNTNSTTTGSNNTNNAFSTNRLPLKETSSNIPSPTLKRAKLVKAGLNSATINNQHHASINTNKPNLTQPASKFHQPGNHQHNHQHINSHHQHDTGTAATATKSTRLVGEELRNWQASWRKIMRESLVYFDTQGYDSSNPSQFAEMKRAVKALKSVGCSISPFFERQVSIIVSRRPFHNAKDYPSTDIFQEAIQYKIKVWDYDKVFRFLKNLGVPDQPSTHTTQSSHWRVGSGVTASGQTSHTSTNANGNLSNLLREERIFGSTDRDPNARRDDLHYLDKNYLYVYDLSQNVRPIAVREWSSNGYPTLNLTLDGKCPFIPDPSENSERKKLRRAQKFAATKEYRDLLKKVTFDIINHVKGGIELNSSGFTGTSTSTDRIDERDEQEDEFVDAQEPLQARGPEQQHDHFDGDTLTDQSAANTSLDKAQAAERVDISAKYDFKAPPAPLLRHSSCVQPPQPSNYNSNSNSNSKFFEAAASGYNGASNAMQCSMDSALNSTAAAATAGAGSHHPGNGLGPMVSSVPSKNINNLKRRIFVKKQKQRPTDTSKGSHMLQQQPQSLQDRDLKPGYCENCRIKYDHFDDHIVSNRHRNFACDDRNFKDIDELIQVLNESKSMGYVTSNGDYSYST